MIVYITGKLARKTPDEAVIEAGGLGYRVLIPTSTYATLPEKGQGVTLQTVHHVREDAEQLYGFATEAERAVFEALTSVSRIGPKLALAALSAMTPAELRDHVAEGDAAILTNISGVGRKTAERLVLELRDRLEKLDVIAGAAPLSGGSETRAEARKDALAALQSLGMSQADAERAIRKALRSGAAVQSADALVRLALKER